MREIVIWGTGVICNEFEKKLTDAEVIAYIESSQNNSSYNGKKVYCIERFKKENLEFDYIVVANAFSNEIYEKCIEYNIDIEKVIFLRPLQNTKTVEMATRNLDYLFEIAPDYIEEALRESDKRMGIDGKESVIVDKHPLYYWDYFRFRTFELVADQIKNLKGSIAEVGVFQGYFASVINEKFPNDIFYLFDTFEGFEEKEALRELDAGNCDEAFVQCFKKTSEEEVIKKLRYPNVCRLRKGLFPKTAEGIEDVFKFVSIDVDFEDSTYAALEFFCPRLVKGGFIFLHDYHEVSLRGVMNAVNRYESKYGELIKIPIADKCGTLIVTK